MAPARRAAALALLLAAPSLARAEGDVEGPGGCVALHCGVQLAECLLDKVCRTWSTCNQKCGTDDMPCQIRCGDLYKPTDATSDKINSFSECVISQNHCVPQGHLTCKLPANAARYTTGFAMDFMKGIWYITKGWNPLFDCFDCQVHDFTLDTGSAPKLHGDLKYSVKQNMSCTAPSCDYLPREVHQSWLQDAANSGHLINHNNSAAEMHYSDDWYVLAAKADTYALIYYCGCNDAICGYSGAVLYTRSPTFSSLSAQDVADLRAAVAAAQVDKFDFDGLCSPSNAACMPTTLLNV